MGQKAHPRGLRLGYIVDWQSRWFAPRQMPDLIGEDFKIRSLIKNAFRQAAVSSVVIERAGSYLRVNIHTARPGVVIGKRGADIEALRTQIESLTARKTFVNVMEIKEPELDAKLVAEAIASQLEKRIAYRRAMRRAMERTMQAGALGIKVRVGGRLNGSEIARTEWLREGRIPLHTYSADIDYGAVEAMTVAGLIGVKVWIFKKLLFVKNPKELLKFVKKDSPVLTAGHVQETQAAAAQAEQKPAAQEAPRADA
ncbi:MAG: 30S ribosomal protein S3 [Elusimicrobia bacterium]|nr:30S ribosomal protein S3 [Elusimicrobiota bacterium]MDE2312627.1 30S ribosomal protein S3 [Elusimicrobiota bacterium]